MFLLLANGYGEFVFPFFSHVIERGGNHAWTPSRFLYSNIEEFD